MVAKSFMFSPVKMLLRENDVEFKRNDYYTLYRQRTLELGQPDLQIMFTNNIDRSEFFCSCWNGGWINYDVTHHPIIYELLLAYEYKLIMDYWKKID